jgi:type IV pilus assembly protein PilQ
MALTTEFTFPKWLGALAIGLMAMIFSQAIFAQNPRLLSVQVNSLEDDRVQLHMKFDGAVTAPKSFAIDNPSKIVLDFPNVKNGLTREQSRPQFNVGAVQQVSVVEAGNRTRVVISLKESVPFVVDANGKDATITLSGKVAPLQSDAQPFQGKVYDNHPQKVVGKFSIKNIDFRRSEQGAGRVIIDLNHRNVPIDLKEEGTRVRLRFIGAQLPSSLQRKLDVTDFGTPVTGINTVQKGNDVEMLIDVSGYSENIAYQANNRFTLEVRPLTQEQKEQIQAKTFKFTGERLSLNFQDIEVRAVLQLIADFTGLNIVTSDTVTGNVTLRLRNVPWDEALDIIMRTKGLGKRQVGDVIMIGPSEEIAAREKLELQSRQQVQDLSPLRAEYVQVNYAKASEIAVLLKTEKNSLLSARGTVSVDDRTNTLLVQDTAAKLEEVRAVVHRLDVPVRQVLIESRLVFANDDFHDALGVTFGGGAKFRPGKEPVAGFAGSVQGSPQQPGGAVLAGGDAGGADAIAQGSPPATQSVGDRLAVNLPALLTGSSFAQFGMAIAKLPGGTILDLELMALESEGLGKIVASPRLITSNQQQAYIESGTEIPYQEASSSGATSVSFKKAVLRLEVTPQITPDDHIILDLKINQDQADFTQAVLGVPSINTREMHTKVLVANGETIVLGGIYQQTKSLAKQRVPYLGKLPVIGWMFRNQSTVDQRNELMIFVTPKIIQEGVV